MPRGYLANMNKITVIIPTWNEEKHLPNLLEDLSSQIMKAEIIISDANSTDRTREIAEEFGARVVEGGLPAVGRNAGAKAAKGEWLIFLDADVRLPNDGFLDNSVSECEKRGLAVATAPIYPEEGGFMDSFFHAVYNFYMRLMENLIPHATGACIIVKKSVFEKVGGFNEKITFAEDQEFVGRAAVFKFAVLRTVSVRTSVRRLEHEGRFKFALKYLWAEVNILRHGFVKPGKVPYDLRPPR